MLQLNVNNTAADAATHFYDNRPVLFNSAACLQPFGNISVDSTTQHLTCPAVFIIFIWVPSESISILLLEAQQYFTVEETEEEGDTLVSGIKLFCQGLLPGACLLPKRLAVKFIFKVFAAKLFYILLCCEEEFVS